jgi:DNA-binding beta-propeller fold protein YncE
LLLATAAPSGAGPLPERVVLSERATSTLRVFNADDLFTGAVNAIPPTAGVQPIRTGSTPQETVASPNGRIAFVANFNSGYISVVDLVIGAEIRRMPVRIRSR